MNKKAQASIIGFSLLVALFLFVIVVFATIEPMKESLDNNRGNSSGLNCPGTPDFVQDNYDDDTDFEKLVRRPPCFIMGISMVWFVGAFLIAAIVWVARNWRRK